MTWLELWQHKILQTFHDPPGKPFRIPKRGGHERLARMFLERFFKGNTSLPFPSRLPDFMAAGADRPVVDFRRNGRRYLEGIRFTDPKNNLITHPLAAGAVLELPYPTVPAELDLDDPRASKLTGDDPPELDEPRASELTGDERPDWEFLERVQSEVAEALGSLANAEWSTIDALKRAYWSVWRRWRDDLRKESSAHFQGAAAAASGSAFWAWLPADTRSPDHSIWEHNRVASAVAFVRFRRSGPGRRAVDPWLLTVSLSPIQRFIAEAHSSRDLWLGSYLVADLAFHAMRPVFERYGPDAIVYPDLRGNPRMDHWLKSHAELQASLPDGLDPASFASMIPDSFTAIVPFGPDGGGEAGTELTPLAELARKCDEDVKKRWEELAGGVRRWLERQKPFSEGLGWKRQWDEQCHNPPIRVSWTAVKWDAPPYFTNLPRGHTLPFPFLAQDQFEKLDEKSEDAANRRARRFEPFVDAATLGHYDWTRHVYHNVARRRVVERGFDYALIHHELRARHKLRGHVPGYAGAAPHAGERCTACRTRTALMPEAKADEIDRQLEHAREVWRALDPDDQGRERLCAVCAVKRFLVEASGFEADGFNSLWAGRETIPRLAEVYPDRPRVPFPSTATIAAQEFLEKVARSPELDGVRQGVVEAHRRTRRGKSEDGPFTSFASALPRLAEVDRANGRRNFLWLDTQTSVFPEACEGQAEMARSRAKGGSSEEADAWNNAAKAVRDLRREAARLRIDAPKKRFAVLRLDGDRLGELLIGTPDRIPTRWRDVIHPRYVETMEASDSLREKGWGTLLDGKRAMGPSLHAFISRALGELAHRIVPWVVEQEFGGRLIYAGGDDVLALVPGDDALHVAARLQQIASAAWIVDTMADDDVERDPWCWRKPEGTRWRFDPRRARSRFAILRTRSDPARLPWERDDIVQPVMPIEEKRDWVATRPGTGELIAGLGPGFSLSAGVTISHYKGNLGFLLRDAATLLDEDAKGRRGGAAAAVALHTRGGEKLRAVLEWRRDDELYAHEALGRAVGAFPSRALAGRLPYKLRALTQWLPEGALDTGPDAEALTRGLLAQSLDGERLHEDVEAAVLWLWQQGRAFAARLLEEARAGHGSEGGTPDEKRRREAAMRALDPLLLCRALAASEEE